MGKTKVSTYDLPAWWTDGDRKSGRMWASNVQNAKVSVRTSPIQPPSTHTWAFAKEISDGQDAIVAINRGPLVTGQTELWLARKNHAMWILPTALPSTDRGECAFAMMNNHRGSDLMAIKMGPETASGKTEHYITDAVGHHMFLKHHYATALGLTDIRRGKWAFCVMLMNHLMAKKMGPVTEVQILSADSQYTFLPSDEDRDTHKFDRPRRVGFRGDAQRRIDGHEEGTRDREWQDRSADSVGELRIQIVLGHNHSHRLAFDRQSA